MTQLYKEDLGIYAKWLRQIIYYHCDNIEDLQIYQHVFIQNKEVDLYLSCGKVTILVEVKELDFPKAISQVFERRNLAKYAYIAIDKPTFLIIRDLKGLPKSWLEEIFGMGIGIASIYDNVVLFKSYSPQKVEYASNYTTLLEYMPNE